MPHIRKSEVHESDIGLVFTKTFDRLMSVRRLRHHRHALLAIDDHGNPFAKESMIVNTEHTDGGVHNPLDVPSEDSLWSLLRQCCSELKFKRELDRARPTNLVERIEAAVRATRAQTARQGLHRVTE